MTNKKILTTILVVAGLIIIVGVITYYYWLKNYKENKIELTEQDKLNTLNRLREESSAPSISIEEQSSILGGLNDQKKVENLSETEKLKILESLSQ